MALYIQKSIQRHIRHRQPQRSKSRPASLREFCEDITWKDIIDTIESTLIKNEGAVIKALR